MFRAHIDDLIQLGYFREFAGNPEQQRDRPKLSDHTNAEAQPDEARIVAYLRAAPQLGVWGSMGRDVLNPDRRVWLTMAEHSDGTYIWSSLLAYYVENYHVAVPADFREHLIRRGWTFPDRVEILYDPWTPPDEIDSPG